MAFTVEESFQITDRGLVIVVNGQTELEVGKEHSARITRPDGTIINAACYKEWLLRHQPVINEREGFLLVGVKKEQVPIGSKVEFNEA